MIDEADKERLRSGLAAALQRLETDEASAVLVLEVRQNGRAVRFWEAGEADELLSAILKVLPLSRKAED